MEAYKITTARATYTDMSWGRVCDVLELSLDGKIWEAHYALEDRAEYRFLDTYGEEMILERM